MELVLMLVLVFGVPTAAVVGSQINDQQIQQNSENNINK